ncbi:MAG: tail fiber protein [Phaeodactylibacter sp.]
MCNGQLLSIAEHQALFSILGTTYGGCSLKNRWKPLRRLPFRTNLLPFRTFWASFCLFLPDINTFIF